MCYNTFMNTVKLENITPDDHRYISLRTKLITQIMRNKYIVEVIYDDGLGAVNVLKRSISSVLSEAIDDVINSSGLFFLLKDSK